MMRTRVALAAGVAVCASHLASHPCVPSEARDACALLGGVGDRPTLQCCTRAPTRRFRRRTGDCAPCRS
eukprot:5836172-Prymnesium_polylepis.1